MSLIANRRWIAVTVVNFVTLFFLGQLNYYLAPIGIQLFLTGMIISFSAMELSYRQGLLSLVPIAFFVDSKSPLPYGFSFILFICLFTIAHVARSRMRREVAASGLAASLLLNLLAFAAYTFAAGREFSFESIHAGPLALNLFSSFAVILLCNSLFFDSQIGALALCGINLAEEQRDAR